jgi:uncharacterized protein (DUF1684 family)
MRSSVFFIFWSFLIVLSLAAFAQAQTFYGTDDLKTFRTGRDKEFRNRAESPLLEEDFSNFKGLNYYDEDKSFQVEARFERTADESYFQMPTSSGVPKKYIKYGVLKFNLGGRQQQLNVYQTDKATLEKYPEYADLLFVPFKDATNGAETYSGGRYIDIKTPKGNKVMLDFNLAYNPSCAYGSDRYSCPIPPKKNFLKIAVKAGEKNFEYFGKKH